MKQKEHKRKAEWINHMKKLQVIVEGSEADMDLESLRATLQKVMNWKAPSHESIH